jgi:hypothetical protein
MVELQLCFIAAIFIFLKLMFAVCVGDHLIN